MSEGVKKNMTEYLAKSLQSARLERFENKRCPKTYCKYNDPMKRGKSH